MKIDVITIFPDYLGAVELSLVGKAIRSGLVSVGVHDLRAWTHDRHRSVDDTPYGGGAGMVMRPEPWGEAIDALATADTTMIIPTPAGRPFDQRLAAELVDHDHLLIGCGRYEGIDARVAVDAARRMRVIEVSLGDYVLNGGEVAALAIIEAVVRLIPGVVGNPASLTTESHAPEHDGLLEGPVYTRPPSWRGLDVPEILQGGDHGRQRSWHRDQALERTRARRPDLLSDGDRVALGVRVEQARPADAGELYTVQRSAFAQEAALLGTSQIPPLLETADQVVAAIAATRTQPDRVFLLARLAPLSGDDPDAPVERAGRIVGAVRGNLDSDDPTVWYVGRLMVAPDVQGRRVGTVLMDALEATAPASCATIRLFAARENTGNVRFYRRRGYRIVADTHDSVGIAIVIMERRLPAQTAPVVQPSG